MSQPLTRLGTIATWLQCQDDPLLYRPDGQSVDDESLPAVPSHIAQWLFIDARALAEATRIVQVLGTTAEVMGRSFQAFGVALRAAGMGGEAFREALPTPGDTPEDAPEEDGAMSDAPMPRDDPRCEAWAVRATAVQMEACTSARDAAPLSMQCDAGCATLWGRAGV